MRFYSGHVFKLWQRSSVKNILCWWHFCITLCFGVAWHGLAGWLADIFNISINISIKSVRCQNIVLVIICFLPKIAKKKRISENIQWKKSPRVNTYVQYCICIVLIISIITTRRSKRCRISQFCCCCCLIVCLFICCIQNVKRCSHFTHVIKNVKTSEMRIHATRSLTHSFWFSQSALFFTSLDGALSRITMISSLLD